MAIFKVGQRVRKIAPANIKPGWVHVVPVGSVGTIAVVGPDVDGREYTVTYDEHGADHAAMSYMLAPLTDPRAQEFIEDMERFSKCTEGVPLVAVQ